MHPNLSKPVCCWSGSTPTAPSMPSLLSHPHSGIPYYPPKSVSVIILLSPLVFVDMKTHPLTFLRYLLIYLHVSFLLNPTIFENYNCGFFIFILSILTIILINSRDFFGEYLLETWAVMLLSKNKCFIFSQNVGDRDLWWSILNF